MLTAFKRRFKRGLSMRLRNLLVAGAACTIAMVSAGPSWAQARGPAKTDDTNPRTARFGVWDNSTNPNNVMTYEAYEKDGSKLTVSNPSNPSKDWSYVTLFDGVYRPVQGQEGGEAAVEIINAKRIRIYNKRSGGRSHHSKSNNDHAHRDKSGKTPGAPKVPYTRRKK